MLRRLFRLIVILPALGAVWAAANSLGVTATVAQATGLDIPDAVTIPGLDKILNANDAVNEAKAETRRAAIRALKNEIRHRYGSQAAALVPNDLTVSEARRILAEVVKGASLDQIKDMLDAPGGPGANPGGPGVVAANGGPKIFNKARTQLVALTVKGRAPMTGYSRAQFGSEWDDHAGNFAWTDNGCNSRDDALRRDLTDVIFKPGSTCYVATGTLRYERYTGHHDVKFVSGGAYENSLDIDHIVALGNVWVTGGQQIGADQRAAIANDPLNLWPVDPSSNRQKADADAATWLPSNKAFRCMYVSRQIAVKTKYHLWVTSPEKGAMETVLAGCPK